MDLYFLPADIRQALSNINLNYLSEIRIRKGQPVIVEYKGEYKYLNPFGVSECGRGGLTVGDIAPIINNATGGCIYNYTEQMKSGFITVGHGIRIGIAGEYVTNSSEIIAIKNITSINIRIPHDIVGCADFIVKKLFSDSLHSTLLYSKPGLGKTTMLRDIATTLGKTHKCNVLVFDERNEISATDGEGNGFDLGDRVDVIRSCNKKSAIASAIRAMKPDVIITDELYGNEDVEAVYYAVNCGICVIASSHTEREENLKSLPFEYYVKLTGVGRQPIIYDKNFDTYRCGGADDLDRRVFVGK
ncbi:MAG: Flp pilus assembly complex ATPase component TadA [Clostridia bacterium]|nr:Flp pilus assembly complex ATPase component TadA [Clostridia bacterium]